MKVEEWMELNEYELLKKCIM